MPSITPIVPITNVGDEAETITNIQNAPTMFWQAMCIVGWMAPDPGKIWQGVKHAIKSIANFVLRLFGRGGM